MVVKEAISRVINAMQIQEYDLAEKLLLQINKTSSDKLFVLITLGNIYEKKGRYKEAFIKYKRAVSLYPNNASAYNNLGLLYKHEKEYEKAVLILNKALSLSVKKADIYYNIGNVYKEISSVDKAVDAYKKAVEDDPGFMPAYINLGILYEQQDQLDEARSVYIAGLRQDPNHPGLHYNLGVIYKNSGQFSKAKNEFLQVVKTKPGWMEALNNYGVVLSGLGESSESIRTFNEILKIQPGNTKALNNIGIEYSRINNLDKAKTYLNKAIDSEPSYLNGIMNLAALYEEKGYYEEALKEYKKVLSGYPHNAQARFRYALLLVILERFNEAEDQLKFIIKNNTKDVAAFRALMNLYIRRGNSAKADQVYSILTGIDPVNKEFYYDMALYYKDRNEFGKSFASITRYLENNPGGIEAQILLGELLYKQKMYEQAEQILQNLIHHHPDIVPPYYYLAALYKDTGREQDAIRVLDKLISLQGTRASSHDLSSLGKSLQLYEELVKKHEDKQRKSHEAELFAHQGLTFDSEDEILEMDKNGVITSLYESVDNPVVMEDIIDDGIIEPLMNIKEEEEILDIDEPEEEIPIQEKIVEIPDEGHTPLNRLLDNEELYEESPLLKDLKKRNDLLENIQNDFDDKKQKSPGKKTPQENNKDYEDNNDLGTGKPKKNYPVYDRDYNYPQQPPVNYPVHGRDDNYPGSQKQPANYPVNSRDENYPWAQREPEHYPPGKALDNQNTGKNHELDSKQEPVYPLPPVTRELNKLLKENLKAFADAMASRPPIPPVIYQMQPIVIQPPSPARKKRKKSPGAKSSMQPEKKESINGQQPVDKKQPEINNKHDQSKPGENSELKDQLKRFLDRIRKKLDSQDEIKPPVDDAKKENLIGLVDNLIDLQDHKALSLFPENEQVEMKLKMECLRDKLSGKPGLKRIIETRYEQRPSFQKPGKIESSSYNNLAGTLAFVKNMVGFLPDSQLKTVLSGKIENVIRKIE